MLPVAGLDRGLEDLAQLALAVGSIQDDDQLEGVLAGPLPAGLSLELEREVLGEAGALAGSRAPKVRVRAAVVVVAEGLEDREVGPDLFVRARLDVALALAARLHGDDPQRQNLSPVLRDSSRSRPQEQSCGHHQGPTYAQRSHYHLPLPLIDWDRFGP